MATKAVVQIDLTDVDTNVTGSLSQGNQSGRVAFNDFIEGRETDSGFILANIATDTLIHSFPDFDLQWDGTLGDASWPKIVAKAGAVGKRVDFSGEMVARTLTQHSNAVRGFFNESIAMAGDELYLNDGAIAPTMANQKWQPDDTNRLTGTVVLYDIATPIVYAVGFNLTVTMSTPADLPELVLWQFGEIRNNEV